MKVIFPHRYRGPLTSANGGYAAGRLASFVDAKDVEVTLRLPPPLDRPLDVRRANGSTLLVDGDEVVAEAMPTMLDLQPPLPVRAADAERARERDVRGSNADFNECFVCGDRPDGDGLGIRVGLVAGREPLHAAPWIATESASELVWAAIDCPGAYAVGAEGRGGTVLGRMTARILRVPDAGEPCVVASWPLEEDGRKLFAGTALFADGGELLALARQTWITPR
ncbi:MAG: hypothetical protein H0U00_09600 [Actinobacteria bacterium]|nr:hypothetical protein [Actinomycetota bacterium]